MEIGVGRFYLDVMTGLLLRGSEVVANISGTHFWLDLMAFFSPPFSLIEVETEVSRFYLDVMTGLLLRGSAVG